MKLIEFKIIDIANAVEGQLESIDFRKIIKTWLRQDELGWGKTHPLSTPDDFRLAIKIDECLEDKASSQIVDDEVANYLSDVAAFTRNSTSIPLGHKKAMFEFKEYWGKVKSEKSQSYKKLGSQLKKILAG